MSNRARHQRSPSLDLSNLDEGYRVTGHLRGDLLDSIADGYGQRFAKHPQDKVSSSQLRRFYSDVKQLQRDIQTNREATWALYEARVRMLKSKVAYAAGRKTISRAFQQFVSKCIEQINDLQSFEDFCLFFESVVGYYYGYEGEGN